MNFSIYKHILFVFFLIPLLVLGQISEDILPWSYENNELLGTYQQVSLLPPDTETILKQEEFEDEYFKPDRFAVMVAVGLNPLNSGTVEKISNGRSIWRLKLSLSGTLASSLYFTSFNLPGGVKLFLYNEEKKELKGAYSENNNRPSGLFATSLIHKDAVILELNIPAGMDLGNWFVISEMTYAYNMITEEDEVKGFGNSDFCEVNINCSPEGDQWQDEKRGVVRLQLKVNGAAYWCTGTMVNNARYDNTPYLLTADHCAFKFGSYATVEDLETWLFYFNYEGTECENPEIEPELFSLTGCEKVANGGYRGFTGSDFYLVRLLDDIPLSWNIYFNGWSAEDSGSDEGVTIHHPNGDIKKISAYADDLVTTGWSWSGLPTHYEVEWVATVNNWGVTEGGSSGAPIYNNDGQLIGTLTGGLASCYNNTEPDYYGKFSYHWASNGEHDTAQLKPWLDPDDTGILMLTGSTMGVKDKQRMDEQNMIVFPNPVQEELHVRFEPVDNIDFVLDIINLMGVEVYSDSFMGAPQEIKLNVGHLRSGVYFLKKTSREGSELRKFVKR